MRYPLDALGGFALLFRLLTSNPTLCNANPAGYEFVGCYVDSNTRVLSVWADGVNNRVSTMTNELCASQCVGYLYFGTEDSNQCMCGNEILPDAVLAPTVATCNEACEGNDNEICGGYWLISIYKLATASVTSTSSSIPSPSSTATNNNGNGNGNGDGDGNGNNVNVQINTGGKSSADGLPGPSKIAIGVTVAVVLLALAGFLWYIVRGRRRLTRQGQIRDVSGEPENRRINYGRERPEMVPELGANVQLDRARYTAEHKVAEAVEVPDNFIEDTRRNVVEIPSNPIYELYNIPSVRV